MSFKAKLRKVRGTWTKGKGTGMCLACQVLQGEVQGDVITYMSQGMSS